MDLIQSSLWDNSRQYLVFRKGIALPSLWGIEGTDVSVILQSVCFWVLIQTIFIAQENKITRDEMVKKMIIIVGEQLLLDSLTKLKYSVSYFGSILYISKHLMITILRVNSARWLPCHKKWANEKAKSVVTLAKIRLWHVELGAKKVRQAFRGPCLLFLWIKEHQILVHIFNYL